jgi:GAF domain-containing protein
MTIDVVIANLLAQTGASRVTLRQDRPGETFPVTHEALASDARSIRNVVTPNMRAQPVVVTVTSGQQVFHEMLEAYGGMRAQIVTPILRDGRVHAILSLHQLGHVRRWTDGDVALCSTAAAEIGELLARGA